MEGCCPHARARARARALLQRILQVVQEGKNFSEPSNLVQLPFPYLLQTPSRFLLDEKGCMSFMGRTGYARLREKLLQLGRHFDRRRPHDNLPPPPKRAKFDSSKLVLWGTMGSGKSYMLAALACDLFAFFKGSVVDGIQRRRVVYVPNCAMFMESSVRYVCIQAALLLSYAEDDGDLDRIASISNDMSAINFFKQEASRGVRIYLIVDQWNSLDLHTSDALVTLQEKRAANDFIESLTGVSHMLVTGASANNTNALRWYSKQHTDTVVFHHGGLDDEEYKHWKEHFKLTFSATSKEDQGLEELDEDGGLKEEDALELRIKDATGGVPLFLQCFSFLPDTPDAMESAWEQFVNLDEIRSAKDALREFITSQLNDEAFMQIRLEMYLSFLSQMKVDASPKCYDCRYLFIDESHVGRYVCGVFRDLIAEVLQGFRRARLDWKKAIWHELAKPKPNRSLLGFLVEQEIVADILNSGVPLHARHIMQCTEIVYFDSGTEVALPIKEGCYLYVSSAFNYHRVDAVVRELKKVNSSGKHSPPEHLHLLNKYSKLRLHVVGVQITIGSLKQHKHSEDEFCSPAAMSVWYPGWDAQEVARYFIWYVLQAEMEEMGGEKELLPRVYGTSKIIGKTRAQVVMGLEHATLYYPLEQLEPCLEKLSKAKRK